jgi:alpha-tubulin suppressor-like RCC1 family protein
MLSINSNIKLSPAYVNRTLSIKSDDITITIPKDDSSFQIGSVIRVLLNGYSNINITSDKVTSMLSTGQNDYGQLGDGNSEYGLISKPLVNVSLSNDKLISISAGRGHSLALDGNGNVYAWGKNDRGQLGVSDINDRKHQFK